MAKSVNIIAWLSNICFHTILNKLASSPISLFHAISTRRDSLKRDFNIQLRRKSISPAISQTEAENVAVKR